MEREGGSGLGQAALEGASAMGPASYAGIDWASRKHALCVVDEGGEVCVSCSYKHTESGLQDLISGLRELDVRRVAIERPDGLLVDRLLEAGVKVLPIPPSSMKDTRRRFSSSGKKSDAFDAFCLAELARTDSHRYTPLRPDSDLTKTLRALTRVRAALVKDRVVLVYRLSDQLETFWPGAARVFHAVDAPISLAFLRRYPSPEDAHELNEERMAAVLKELAYRGHRPPAQLLQNMRSAPACSVGPVEAEVRRATVSGLVARLETIVAQIDDVTSRIFDALHAHPDRDIFVPLFTGPAITPAELIVGFGDDRARYPTADILAAKAGVSPVAKQSGSSSAAVFRYACDHRLREAVSILANATRRSDPWAQHVYDAARARGHRYHHALRILGRAWVRVLWRCWQDEVPYDLARHSSRRRMQFVGDEVSG